jgi:DNA-directed RNA polymerase
MLSIGETFKGAKGIQTWLNLTARLISKSIPEERLKITRDKEGKSVINITKNQVKKEQMTSVIWTTPLGLPIVQPYRKTARKQVMTAIQSVYISDPHAPSEGTFFDSAKKRSCADCRFLVVNCVKQASAFPPNFIHSLDATHLMLTVLECRVCVVFIKIRRNICSHFSSEPKSYICLGTRFLLDSCLRRRQDV